MGRLTGKVALMTGGAHGLGAEGCEALAREGARVAVSDIAEAAGEAVAQRIRENGGDAIFIHLDTTDERSWRSAMDQVVEHYGSLDILVNNAGIEVVKLIEDTSLEDLERLWRINEIGVYLGIKHAIPVMKGHGGSIINLSSVAGLHGFVGLSGYCMTKGGVRLLTKAAAVEFGRLGYDIRVNSIHPGVIRTEMGSRLLDRTVEMGLAGDHREAEKMYTERHPIGRLGEPADVANALVFLASDESAFCTGSELVVDGGISAD